MTKPHTYAFDFDGVIAEYEGFVDAQHVGKPIAEVVEAMRMLKEQGHKIVVHSTRSPDLLRDYCREHEIPFDYINENPDLVGENPGKPVAYVYIDDRTVCYKGQSAADLVKEITEFKAYWQK
jgi:hydroxymethylpyrimidine pyrophosphatase-like HAD family hydrolase